MKVKCSECDGTINLPKDVVVGEIVTCPDCGVDFEVIEIKEEDVVLRTAEAVGEDWGE